ncbi:HAMP domain-containing histidine kinase [Polaribacter litorisediminis]|uniref:sensor histidine kinase n=1 Tax=Polaribacter litorisediminis TaxID=1908341 RepID=UPI001CBA705E|nr:sensor histidine kinase [Polaribacter litorisediminis]UAM98737.1 HAMP domain-containing histidine kinase [Polaribacter litorisediminis]
MRNQNEQEIYDLVEFLNQCPLGIIKADHKGQIVMQNAMASQILMPFCLFKGCSNIDIFAILKEMKPEWLHRIKDFKDSFGDIINNERVAINFPNQKDAVYLNFNVIRINETTYQYAFNDISARVKTEEELNSLSKEKAIESGKLEMAVGVLHDIGNAATAFGTDVARLQNKLEGKEKDELLKLEGLFEKQSKSLDAALGAGKGAALKNFISVLRKSLIHRETESSELVKKLYFTTSHIQEILNIQRSYVKGKTKGERAPFKLSSIIDDALRIQERGLLKRDVKITKYIPLDTPPIKGDKTKLVQVLINAFKNCAEAFDEVKDHREKKLHIELRTESSNHMVVLLIKDNANGFDPNLSEELLEKGNSHKKTGTGFGLYNSKQIIETHQGAISITSKGIGTGAEFLIKLPYIN